MNIRYASRFKLRAAEHFNGREGETVTCLLRCVVSLTLRGGGFAPRHLKRWAASLQIRKGYAMNFAKRWLLVLLVINIGTSILHYVDNILFFHTYPEPPWINPQIIDAFWFVMTPLAVLGYVLYRKALRRYSYLCLYLYALMSLLVLGIDGFCEDQANQQKLANRKASVNRPFQRNPERLFLTATSCKVYS
jgi:hypothetical protein